ncbi:hypothetical protein H6P81_014573 [Aristolochia fimbriata]|uniref:Uncharacterized protein n=1 Tax=Aristolochia fimbriata TaxID=158543 RepID=A0AAV7E3S8_ARIFI|nr:hypothetical protein H6P81_014573 [Aristolochia fimbriata]
MDKPGRIILRRSIHAFLRQYHHFTSAPALILFPFSLALLIIPSSPLFHTIHHRLQSLFHEYYSVGFPPPDSAVLPSLFSLLALKLSQTLSSSLLTLPFALSFLLLAKSHVIALYILLIDGPHPPAYGHLSFLRRRLYAPLLLTHLCNSFLLFSANATALSILFLAFNSFQALVNYITFNNSLLFLISALGALLYSLILANAIILSNLALVVAGMDIYNNNCGGGGGYWATLRASSSLLTTTRERAATALSLIIPTNLALAAVEALFHYRVVKPAAAAYNHSHNFPPPSLLYEAALIAYIYSLLLLLDTIIGCTFYRACKSDATNSSSSSSAQLRLVDAGQQYNIPPCRSYISYYAAAAAAACTKSVDDRLP